MTTLNLSCVNRNLNYKISRIKYGYLEKEDFVKLYLDSNIQCIEKLKSIVPNEDSLIVMKFNYRKDNRYKGKFTLSQIDSLAVDLDTFAFHAETDSSMIARKCGTVNMKIIYYPDLNQFMNRLLRRNEEFHFRNNILFVTGFNISPEMDHYKLFYSNREIPKKQVKYTKIIHTD